MPVPQHWDMQERLLTDMLAVIQLLYHHAEGSLRDVEYIRIVDDVIKRAEAMLG